MTTVYDFTAQDITCATIPLSTYQGKVLLIVNTASKCGFTPQYEGLQRLQKDLADRGFAVLGFPCNQSGHQEPGDAVEIASFCKLTYDVTFPLFSKIDVNGSNAHPLFQWLKKEAKGLLGSEFDQVELHQVPGRPLGSRGEALRSDRCARGFASGYRETLIGLARGLTGLISTRS